MIGVAPVYPELETPDGWTREVKGPRIWLVPPTAGGRIVVAPLQKRPDLVSPERFLEMVLLGERAGVHRLKQTKPAAFTSAQDVPGIIVDIAALDESDQPIEWRCYALFSTPTVFGLMFAQIHPSKHDELRRAFLSIVKTVVMPSSEGSSIVEADKPKLEPWGEL